MATSIAILAAFLYSVTSGLADAFIFRDFLHKARAGFAWKTLDTFAQSADMNTNWHRAQAAQQVFVLGAFGVLSGVWQVIPLGAALFWLLHDGIVNRIGLDRPFFYVGATAWIDRQLQRLFKNPARGSAVLKIGLLVASLASLAL